MINYHGFLEKKLKVSDFIVTKSDLKGNIIYANQIFINISGFKENELLNQPHNIVRHEDMPSVIFKFLWEELKKDNEVFAFVKNKSKDNSFYWVFAHVTPSKDENDKITGYYSVRRKPSYKAIEFIEKFYDTLKEEEYIHGKKASEKLFYLTVKDKETYNKIINNLQKDTNV